MDNFTFPRWHYQATMEPQFRIKHMYVHKSAAWAGPVEGIVNSLF